MSDVEFLLSRNWEQRRHAEEFAAQLAEENKVIWMEKIATVPAEPYNDSEDRKHLKRNRGRKAKAAKAAGRMALVMSAAAVLAGLDLLFPLGILVAVIFYTLYFELQEGRNGLWLRSICTKWLRRPGSGWLRSGACGLPGMAARTGFRCSMEEQGCNGIRRRRHCRPVCGGGVLGDGSAQGGIPPGLQGEEVLRWE